MCVATWVYMTTNLWVVMYTQQSTLEGRCAMQKKNTLAEKTMAVLARNTLAAICGLTLVAFTVYLGWVITEGISMMP
jgi:hypothetical protein